MPRAVRVGTAATVLAGLAIAAGPSRAEIRFVEKTKEAGLYEATVGMMGHGGAWGDFDGDGRIDLYLGGFCDRPDKEYAPDSGPVPNRLYRNRGDGTFALVDQPVVAYYGRTSGAVFADLDNDGDLELYAANNARSGASPASGATRQQSAQRVLSKLFRNDGGKFVDVSAESGACPDTLLSARNIGVLDYDRDGLLDLLVVEDKFVKKPRTTLFRNLGGLRFEDVNARTGLADSLIGLGLAVADVDEDGRPDFFLPHSQKLFLATSDGKYVESPQNATLFAWKSVKPRETEDWPCGAHFADLNRDGRLDLVLGLHFEQARNKVYLNEGLRDGVPHFRDATREVGLPESVPQKSPHVEVQDFDNDGWPDLYFSTGRMNADGSVVPLVYRNLGAQDGVPRFAPPREFKEGDQLVYWPAGPSGDYDDDGRIDLFLVNWFRGNHSRLLHNESPPRRWLDVTVRGTKTLNRMGIGAQVRVYEAGKLGDAKSLIGFQELTVGYGYASGQPAVCHFGLADRSTVDVRIRFPDGTTKDLQSVAADRRLTVEGP